MKVVEFPRDEKTPKIVVECKYFWPDPGKHIIPKKLNYLR